MYLLGRTPISLIKYDLAKNTILFMQETDMFFVKQFIELLKRGNKEYRKQIIT